MPIERVRGFTPLIVTFDCTPRHQESDGDRGVTVFGRMR